MMARTYFAYGVLAQGKKISGGCCWAESMEGAALRAARMCELKIVPRPEIMGRVDYDFVTKDGRKANLYVFAQPESPAFASLRKTEDESVTSNT
jgi:hypothetical protein